MSSYIHYVQERRSRIPKTEEQRMEEELARAEEHARLSVSLLEDWEDWRCEL